LARALSAPTIESALKDPVETNPGILAEKERGTRDGDVVDGNQADAIALRTTNLSVTEFTVS
jgi:hypothetical protein